MSETVSVPDVQARWAYSEFVDSPNFAAQYETQQFAFLYRHELDALRAKRQRGVPFSDLTPDDRYWLALMCNSFRIVLCLFFTGIERFCEVHLNKGQLAALIVPPMVSAIPRFMPFQDYIQTPCPAPGDARNVQP